MKSKHVQRGITNYTKRMSRVELGRLTRLAKVDVEDEEELVAKPQNIRMTFQERLKYGLYFTVVIAFLAFAVTSYYAIRDAKTDVAFVSDEEAVLKIKHPNQKEALAIANAFLEATELAHWKEIIRDSQEDAERAFAQFSQMKQDGWRVKNFNHTGPRQVALGFVNSIELQDHLGKKYILDLVHDNQKWKVDASALLQMNSKAWDDFFDAKSTSGTVRVTLSNKSTYYNGRYSDDKIWQAFQLNFQLGERPIIGYAKRNSASYIAIVNMLKKAIDEGREPEQKCLLEIHRDVQAATNQYEIERVLSPDWLASEQIFSDLFIDQVEASESDSQAEEKE